MMLCNVAHFKMKTLNNFTNINCEQSELLNGDVTGNLGCPDGLRATLHGHT